MCTVLFCIFVIRTCLTHSNNHFPKVTRILLHVHIEDTITQCCCYSPDLYDALNAGSHDLSDALNADSHDLSDALHADSHDLSNALNAASNYHSDELSAGAIVGIVIGSLAEIGLMVAMVIIAVNLKMKKTKVGCTYFKITYCCKLFIINKIANNYCNFITKMPIVFPVSSTMKINNDMVVATNLSIFKIMIVISINRLRSIIKH